MRRSRTATSTRRSRISAPPRVAAPHRAGRFTSGRSGARFFWLNATPRRPPRSVAPRAGERTTSRSTAHTSRSRRIASGEKVGDLQDTINALAEAPCGQGYGRFVLGHLAYAAGEWERRTSLPRCVREAHEHVATRARHRARGRGAHGPRDALEDDRELERLPRPGGPEIHRSEGAPLAPSTSSSRKERRALAVVGRCAT